MLNMTSEITSNDINVSRRLFDDIEINDANIIVKRFIRSLFFSIVLYSPVKIKIMAADIITEIRREIP